MFEEIKNLKDSATNSNIAIKDSSFSMSYSKTTKLVTALYMVTDVMDKEEPLRSKLRFLGTSIISDINLLRTPILSGLPLAIETKIGEVLSFLDIASAVGMISAMNFSILKKEFLELKQSITEPKEDTTLAELFKEEKYQSIGHSRTRIGVQKGSTLMKALSDKTSGLSDTRSNINLGRVTKDINHFNVLKQERREEILKIIKDKQEANITDIKNLATGVLASCGEKTLQRELVSMVKDNILQKTGSKRWSRYFLPK